MTNAEKPNAVARAITESDSRVCGTLVPSIVQQDRGQQEVRVPAQVEHPGRSLVARVRERLQPLGADA